MMTLTKLGLAAFTVSFAVAACDKAPTTPSATPPISPVIIVDNEGAADGGADFEALELCKVWVGAAAVPTSFDIQATDPVTSSVLNQTVVIDGSESPTPGCKVILQFDGTTTFTHPAQDISIVEQPLPSGWDVTSITENIVVRDGGTVAQVNPQSSTATGTWTGDFADNRHGILVTFTNTFTPTGGEGCTPGFWKNHLTDWVGFAPGDSYDAVFGVTSNFGGTLLQALNRGGGGEAALGRHAVAALLNAASPDVDYDLTVAQVIAAVQAAYASGDFEGVKDDLEDFNEQGCPL